MAYISNCLTHWVGGGAPDDDERYKILTEEIIGKRRLLFSKCDSSFRSKYGGFAKGFSVSMICFTDIPFSEVRHHCQKYSEFGIAFRKYYLANCLVSPVGYVTCPFISTAFSDLFLNLSGIETLVDGKTIPEGKRRGKAYDSSNMLQNLSGIAYHLENYDIPEYRFNEMKNTPRSDQETYFDKDKALYYEREWRVVERPGSKFEWDEYESERHYLKFKMAYVAFIIMPREYLNRFAGDLDKFIVPSGPTPSLLAYEDLEFF